jgi:hypothetical protein
LLRKFVPVVVIQIFVFILEHASRELLIVQAKILGDGKGNGDRESHRFFGLKSSTIWAIWPLANFLLISTASLTKHVVQF